MDSRNRCLPGVPSALMPVGLTSYARESRRHRTCRYDRVALRADTRRHR